MANSPSILENCHPSWLALQPKRTSQSSFGKWLADCYRGWMAVKHGVAPGYEAQAPCILDSESKRYRPRLAPRQIFVQPSGVKVRSIGPDENTQFDLYLREEIRIDQRRVDAAVFACFYRGKIGDAGQAVAKRQCQPKIRQH